MSKKSPEFVLPKLWDDSSLRPYLGEIRRRHGIVETLALPSMRDLPPLRIETLFVAPLLAENPVHPDSDPKLWPEGQSLLEALQATPQLVVLGDPGGGKTTLSNWLAWRLSAGLTTPLPAMLEDCVPLPCVLREMPPTIFIPDTTLPKLAECSSYRLLGDETNDALKASLYARVKAGKYVLILDGVDEIPVPHRKIVADWVRQARLQNACVLATSRIVGYEDGPVDRSVSNPSNTLESMEAYLLEYPKLLGSNPDKEITSDLRAEGYEVGQVVRSSPHPSNKFESMKAYVELIKLSGGDWGKGGGLEGKYFTPDQFELDLSQTPIRWAQLRYLMPFDQNRITAFAENWYRQRCGTEHEARQKAGDLLSSLAQSEATQQLARTPNLLSLMAIVHRERSHLPDGKALLYDEIANAYINTIDKQRKIVPGDALAPYGWKERRAWLAYVGFQMQLLRSDQQNANEKTKDGVLASEADVLDWLAHAMQVSGVDQPEQAAQVFLGWVARRSGLLLPRGEGRYAFVHLSFQEYFCACYLSSRIVRPAFIRDKLSEGDAVSKPNLAAWTELTVWRETLVYLFELLSAERDADWVDDLAEILFKTDLDSTQLFSAQAALAGRVLADRHIRLGEEWKDLLADRCIQQAEHDWNMRNYESAMTVLPALLDAGYAALVATPSSTSDEALNPVLSVRSLTSIEDIKTGFRLRICFVMNINLTDISPLAGFYRLQTLILTDTQVADISAVVGLNHLQRLDLSGTQVTDISPLAGLNNLQRLDISSTHVADISPLAGLSNLRRLYLSGTQVTDISPMASLNNLQTLLLMDTQITDISPLAGLNELQMLILMGEQVADITPLAGLNNLETLFLMNTQVVDIFPLAGLNNLEALVLTDSKVVDVTPLAGLNNLHSLSLNNCPVTNITPLAELRNLQSLSLNNCPVANVTPLAGLKGLQTLYLAGTDVSDLSPLGGLCNLQSLHLADTGVVNVTPLTGLQNLQEIDLSRSHVLDISPLAELNNLQSLDLSGTQVLDETPLKELKNLVIKRIPSDVKSQKSPRKKRKSSKTMKP